MRIRKQENDLTIADLIQFAAWEYALDEEYEQGQNEKTLRPYLMSPPLDLQKAYLLVRTRFILSNGDLHIGFVKPIKLGEQIFMQPILPYDLNPVIVTERGHVNFCYGTLKPEEATILENYKCLGYESDDPFPIEFLADIEVCNGIVEGMLEGFLYFEHDPTDFFRLIASDVKFVK